MSGAYLWIKAFHIVFVASWFAFNEASLMLFAVTVVLVVVKPF